MVSPILVSATRLDARRHETHLAHRELVDLDELGCDHAHLLDREGLLGGQQADLHPLAEGPVDDAHQHDDAAIGVEPGIEDQGLERLVVVPSRAAGAGATMASRISSVPIPSLALARMASLASRPMMFSIWSLIR